MSSSRPAIKWMQEFFLLKTFIPSMSLRRNGKRESVCEKEEQKMKNKMHMAVAKRFILRFTQYFFLLTEQAFAPTLCVRVHFYFLYTIFSTGLRIFQLLFFSKNFRNFHHDKCNLSKKTSWKERKKME